MPRPPSSKRDTIKFQALRLFGERGVDAVSVQDIATACDMAKPNLYAHFKSKDDLVQELFQEGYRDYGHQMADAIAAGGPFRVKLDRVVRLICRLHDADSLRFRFILMSQHANLPTVDLGQRNPVEIVVRLVAGAMQEGEIPTRDAVLVSAGIVGLVVQPATFLQYGRLDKPLAKHADEIVSMCLRVATSDQQQGQGAALDASRKELASHDGG
jgi:AcrR family transcriptional regulator